MKHGFWLSLLVPAIATAAPLETDGPLAFDGFLLELPGKVELTYYGDIDRDDLVDVIAVYSGEEFDDPPRNLAVYFQTSSGFAATPDLTLRLDDTVSVIDIGDVSPEHEGEELVLLDHTAVRWMPLSPGQDPGAARVLVEVDPLFAFAERLELDKRDFARSVDEGEAATLFIPRTSGYRVFYPDDGYATAHDFAANHSHQVSSSFYGVSTADLHLADLDGDGHHDLIFTHRDQLRAHFQVDDRFSPDDPLDRNLEVLTRADREAPEELDNLIGFSIEDFDGDGLADLFVFKTVIQSKAVVNDKKQYQLFRNRGGSFGLTPDQAFVLKSFDRPTTLDINGDDRLDMVTGYFEFSLGNIVKALLSKRFSIDLSFFLFGEDGYPDQPDEKRDFKIRISLSNLDENFAPAVEIDGDFDGDGHHDFLMQTEDQKLEIWRAATDDDDRIFEKKSSITIKALACDNSHVEDFNHDGKADIAFDRFPDREPYQENWIHVVLSRPSQN